MKLNTFPDPEALAEFVADTLIAQLRQKPDSVICLASGNSPKLTCAVFTGKAKAEGLDTSRFFFVGLDEWVGLEPGTPGSCANDFQTRLFGPLHMASSQYHLFNGLSDDLRQECFKMDELLAVKGGIDLMIVGIGMNGHIGFNEPGTSWNNRSHVIKLHETTSSVGQKYFQERKPLDQGITLGFAHLLAAKQVILLADGEAKAEVIKTAVEGPPDEDFPATVMQLHPNGIIAVDAAAASQLTPKNSY